MRVNLDSGHCGRAKTSKKIMPQFIKHNSVQTGRKTCRGINAQERLEGMVQTIRNVAKNGLRARGQEQDKERTKREREGERGEGGEEGRGGGAKGREGESGRRGEKHNDSKTGRETVFYRPYNL